MEGNAHLLQLIRKMRSQINRLERENRALKGELESCGQRAERAPGAGNGGARSLACDGEGPAAPAASPASRQGRAAAAAAPREQTGTEHRGCPGLSPWHCPCWMCHPGWALPAGNADQLPAAQLSREQEKGLEKSPASCVSYSHSSNMKLFQEHIYKCQGKVKAVSFLLPTDMSSFAEGSLKSPQN
ncbi:hypothetical protein Nmel_011650 [Mimus melanotis]